MARCGLLRAVAQDARSQVRTARAGAAPPRVRLAHALAVPRSRRLDAADGRLGARGASRPAARANARGPGGGRARGTRRGLAERNSKRTVTAGGLAVTVPLRLLAPAGSGPEHAEGHCKLLEAGRVADLEPAGSRMASASPARAARLRLLVSKRRPATTMNMWLALV